MTTHWRSLLPIASLARFLPAFCESWRRETRARTAVAVVVLPPLSKHSPAAMFLSDKGVAEPLPAPRWEELRTHGFARLAEEWWPDRGAADAIRQVHPLPEHEELWGGVVLEFDASTPERPSERQIAEWLTESIPLLVQAVWMERAIRSPELQAALEREKFEAMAEFAAGAGHEINNPVATIYGRAQQLLPGEKDIERRQQLLTIGAQALRIRDMIGDTMLFARPPRPDRQRRDLAEVLRDEAATLREAATERGIELRLETPANAFADVDHTQFCVVLHALVRNSIEAASPGGRILVRLETVTEEKRTWARLIVADNGPGLTEKDRRHLFDPFYSGRQAGRGLGFGLPKSRRIVEQHGGRINVQSQPGETIVHADWPMP